MSPRREEDVPRREIRDVVRKLILAVGFDVNRERAVVKLDSTPEAGEPAIGVGDLQPPWAGQGDHPFAWALTPLGRSLQGMPIAGLCPDFPGHVPQPGHGRWRNPRDPIRVEIEPGVYSSFVDDLDCASDPAAILKLILVVVWSGSCDFASGGRWLYPSPSGGYVERPGLLKLVSYDEEPGWSLQPGAVVFPAELLVQDRRPSRARIHVLKASADEAVTVTSSQEQIDVPLNPRPVY